MEQNRDVKSELLSEGFYFPLYNNNHLVGKIARDHPEGRGIFYNKDKNIYCWINYEDHLSIISTQNNDDIVEIFKQLCIYIRKIECNLKFSSIDNLG